MSQKNIEPILLDNDSVINFVKDEYGHTLTKEQLQEIYDYMKDDLWSFYEDVVARWVHSKNLKCVKNHSAEDIWVEDIPFWE
jgi:GGDEF domain-containing protein